MPMNTLVALTSVATALAVIVTTDSVHPLPAVALGALCAALGWAAYGSWLMSKGEITARQFFMTTGLAMMAGVVGVVFVPIDDFTKLLVVCAIAGTASEEILKRVRAGVVNMFGKAMDETPTKKSDAKQPDNNTGDSE